MPPHANQQHTSPDITNTLQRNTDWATMQALSSDHLNLHDHLQNKDKLQNTYTKYNKANWQEFTQEIEQTLANTETQQNAHTATKILTNAILAADKHHIPKGKLTTHKNYYQKT